jgi:hypothetical protein
MARLNFWAKPKGRAHRKRGAAELLPELFEIPASARRANRLLGAVAIIGAFGTVALAVALTPGAQHSPSTADAAQTASPQMASPQMASSQMASSSNAEATAEVTMASSIMAPAAAPAEKPSEPAAVLVAAPPQRAEKADRLTQISWAPEAGSSEHLPDVDRRGALLEAERPAQAALYGPEPALGLDPEGEPESERETGPDFALGYPEPPAPGATGLEASDSADAGADFTVEPSAAAGDELTAEVPETASAPTVEEEPAHTASLAPPEEEAEPEEVKTRTAPVNSDVNLRAGPDNKAKVIRTVPRNSKVEVIGCNFWCEVFYAGKRGYIYKKFIPGAKS